MQHLKRKRTSPHYVPDFMATSVLDIDFKLLHTKGIRYIAFDADSTLVQFRGKELSKESKTFLQEQRNLFDGWCIASNRITNDLLPLAESMDAQIVQATLFTRKPQKRFYKWVLRHFGGKPQEIAMIGDKLIADMYGAKRMGLMTVWVQQMGKDSIWDRVFNVRRWERRLMKSHVNS